MVQTQEYPVSLTLPVACRIGPAGVRPRQDAAHAGLMDGDRWQENAAPGSPACYYVDGSGCTRSPIHGAACWAAAAGPARGVGVRRAGPESSARQAFPAACSVALWQTTFHYQINTYKNTGPRR
jgi:hypothetical protein